MRTRAELLAHGHNTHAPYTLPDIGKKIAYKANREGGAERLNDPAVPQTSEGALALITSDDALLRACELSIGQTAQPHAAHPLDGLPTAPGRRKILRLVLLDAIHDLGRLPRVQDLAAYARLVTCRKASAGQR